MRKTLLAIGWLALVLSSFSILGHTLFPAPHLIFSRSLLLEHPFRSTAYLFFYNIFTLIALILGLVSWRIHKDVGSKILVQASLIIFVLLTVLRFIC